MQRLVRNHDHSRSRRCFALRKSDSRTNSGADPNAGRCSALSITQVRPLINLGEQFRDLDASLMSALAEFERDLLRERVRSGIAAARKRGVVFGRRPGQRIKADRCAAKVLKLVAEGQSYREISHRLGLSKNTVLDIVKRNRHLKNS
jgi:DNA invertase Pin-like site-specific DNA recombinase